MKLVFWATLTSLVIYASSSLSNASLPRKTSFDITFPESIDLPLGTSVVLEGLRIGFLSDCNSLKDICTVTMEKESNLLRNGAMAVVSSTWAGAKQSSVSYIEILNPLESQPIITKDRFSLPGYTDFESFWKNKKTTHWVDSHDVPLG